MLSDNIILKHRKLIEGMYRGRCTIIEPIEVEIDGATRLQDKIVAEDINCLLAYASSPATVVGNSNAVVSECIKLFIAPEVEVSPGAAIVVTQNGVKATYHSAGKASVYATHQTITLDGRDVI